MIPQQEFENILGDTTKKIESDLLWSDHPTLSHAQQFEVRVLSESGWPLKVVGRWNPLKDKLSYIMVLDGPGRILGLDMGEVGHRNPDGQLLQGTHKHRWTVEHEDKQAYVPMDITAPWYEPERVWRQFCTEVNIRHYGTLEGPTGRLERDDRRPDR